MDPQLLAGESKYIEYKKEYTKTLLKTVCAFANYHDGYILVGIDDEGVPFGIDNIEEVRLNIENSINDAVDPGVYFEISSDKLEGKDIIVLKVYKGDHTPYTINNKAYKRADTSTIQVDNYAFQELILLGRNQGYENLSSDVQELDFAILGKKLKDAINIKGLTDDLLITLGLKNNGGYNNAAALLSDRNPIESSVVQLIAYADDTVIQIKDRQTLKELSILEQYDYCMDFYRKHINVSEIIEGPYRETIEEVPLVAYREAIANAILHRDYFRLVDLRIEVFSDRVEIYSPGGLPVGISEDEYKNGKVSIPRNRLLADIFLRLKIIEKLATGIRRIKEHYKSYTVKPGFEVSENSILVVLPKVSADSNENTYVSSRIAGLSEMEYEIYRFLKKNGAMNRSEIEQVIGIKKSQTNRLLVHMREMGLIAKLGNGPSTKYIIRTGGSK